MDRNRTYTLKLTTRYEIDIRSTKTNPMGEYVPKQRDHEIFVDVFYARLTWLGEERAWYWARQDCRYIN